VLGADLVANPSRYLQMQMVLATTDQQLLQLRQRMTTQECGSGGCNDATTAEAAAMLEQQQQAVERLLDSESPAAQAAGSVAKQLPMFISDPEPAWLTYDIKQR
jgi:hypothetical protein